MYNGSAFTGVPFYFYTGFKSCGVVFNLQLCYNIKDSKL